MAVDNNNSQLPHLLQYIFQTISGMSWVNACIYHLTWYFRHINVKVYMISRGLFLVGSFQFVYHSQHRISPQTLYCIILKRLQIFNEFENFRIYTTAGFPLCKLRLSVICVCPCCKLIVNFIFVFKLINYYLIAYGTFNVTRHVQKKKKKKK